MIWSAVIDNYKVARQQVYTGGWYWHWPETEKTWLEMPLDFKSQGDMDLKNQGGGERSSEHPDMFDLASYHKWNDYRWSAMYVRFVSPQAKIELENVFVSRNIFSFSCPLLLTYFLNQLLAGHRPLLRSITLRLFGCLECYYCGEECIKSDCRAWVAVIERLPATLQIVTIELGQHGINFFNCGACTIPGSQTSKDIKKAVGLLEIVTKRVRRYAPKAKISMAGLDRLCDTGRETMQSMFDEVEPFSEDFLKWSDQSRKNATD